MLGFKRICGKTLLMFSPLRTFTALSLRNGHWKSVRTRSSVDRLGNPLPWYTYPAITYLEQIDFGGRRVFEYGCGNSTLFWASRASEVVTVEDDASWHGKIAADRPPNVRLELKATAEEYVGCIQQAGGKFDVIVVDGRYRKACCHEGIAHLNPGGMVILDNSDRVPGAAAVLRDADLIQVDMTGFGPQLADPWTTSLFLHPQFRMRCRH